MLVPVFRYNEGKSSGPLALTYSAEAKAIPGLKKDPDGKGAVPIRVTPTSYGGFVAHYHYITYYIIKGCSSSSVSAFHNTSFSQFLP